MVVSCLPLFLLHPLESRHEPMTADCGSLVPSHGALTHPRLRYESLLYHVLRNASRRVYLYQIRDRHSS